MTNRQKSILLYFLAIAFLSCFVLLVGRVLSMQDELTARLVSGCILSGGLLILNKK